MKRTYEIQVCIPSGCRLVGCKTDGDIAVVIFEDVSGPEIRQIGFIRELRERSKMKIMNNSQNE